MSDVSAFLHKTLLCSPVANIFLVTPRKQRFNLLRDRSLICGYNIIAVQLLKVSTWHKQFIKPGLRPFSAGFQCDHTNNMSARLARALLKHPDAAATASFVSTPAGGLACGYKAGRIDNDHLGGNC